MNAPLSSPMAERMVLAELMNSTDPAQALLNLPIRIDLFTQPVHRAIFSAVTATVADQGLLDVATLEQRLDPSHLGYLMEAMQDNVSSANLPAHVHLLHECQGRRQQKALQDRAAKMLAAGDADLEAVKALLEASADPNLARVYARTREADAEVEMLLGESIRSEAVRWLWDGWLAEGKIHLIAGPSGTGKTTTAMALAATVSSGGRWPSGEWSEARNVVIWTGEDDLADTLIPRLKACGANMKRIYFVGNFTSASGKRSFDPATDIPELQKALMKIGNVGLLIADPIVSAVAGDSHKNGEVRRSLQPLVDLAMTTRCAVLGVTHFSKATNGRDPVERVTGSIAFGALARVVMAVVKASDAQGGGRLLVRAKSNLGPDTDGYKFDLRQIELGDCPGVFASYVAWGEAIKGDARDLLGQAEKLPNEDERSELEDAKAFLIDLLADGPVDAKQVREDAEGNGHAWRTIERAKKDLSVVVAREGFGKDGKFLWTLPPNSQMLLV